MTSFETPVPSDLVSRKIKVVCEYFSSLDKVVMWDDWSCPDTGLKVVLKEELTIFVETISWNNYYIQVFTKENALCHLTTLQMHFC